MTVKNGNEFGYRLIKAAFDVTAAFVLSLLTLLPLAVLALLVLLKDHGNPFYVQERMGRDGRVVKLAKLRTMRRNADQLEAALTAEELQRYRVEYKLDDDPRLLGWEKPGDGNRCFGALLRRFSIDELPQIPWNILIRRDMSFVGPRPVLQEELLSCYNKEEQAAILSVKPGLTGYWQAYARNNVHYADGKRQQMELYYVKNRSLALDMQILLATVGAVLSKRGAG